MPRFSIVVPVYNVEDYLDECVHSVINQSYKDWELILVDDGSPDNCPQLCDEYASRDNRIKVIHKENGGLSSARNTGLDYANGDYVLFLDSDDYWNQINALELIAEKLLVYDYDIVIFGCTDFNQETDEIVITRSDYNYSVIDKNDKDSTLHYLLSTKDLPGGSTVFAFKKSLVNDNSIRFKEKIQDEDYDFVLGVFFYAKSITAIDDPFYMYRKSRIGSITKTSSIKEIKGIEYTIEKWLPKIKEEITHGELERDYLNYLAFIYSTGFVACGRMNHDDRREALKIMKRHKDVLKYAYWKKPIITRYAIKIIGMNAFSVLAAKYFDRTHI